MAGTHTHTHTHMCVCFHRCGGLSTPLSTEEEEQTESLGLGEAKVLSRAQLSCFMKMT